VQKIIKSIKKFIKNEHSKIKNRCLREKEQKAFISRSSDGCVAVGTHGRGVFLGTRDPAEINDDNHKDIPLAYTLAQNYPNPFNPSTTIEYTLPETQRVFLRVYDALGQVIATLENSYKSAGRHKVVFERKDLPSGLYFYQIMAGPFTDSKKFVLLR